MNWIVYILRCSDNTFYCGVTNNLERRIIAHNSRKGAKYTKYRTPVVLMLNSKEMSKSEAMKLEYKIKQLPRDKKLEYLAKFL